MTSLGRHPGTTGDAASRAAIEANMAATEATQSLATSTAASEAIDRIVWRRREAALSQPAEQQNRFRIGWRVGRQL